MSSIRVRARTALQSLLPALAAAAFAPVAPAQTWATDFVAEDIGASWTQPTCVTFCDPNEMLVAEKGGLLWNVRGGVKRSTPVIDLRDEILNNGDRGLLSVLADEEWTSNGYIYLLYIVDPNGDGVEAEQESFGRLTRYTTYKNATGDLLADPASRLVLIGNTWPEGIPSIHLSHSVGDMRWGEDGSLFLSTGDGAHYDLTDNGGFDPNGFGAGKFPPSEDIGAFRSQSITSLAGKILRIDPATGEGLPDNPYWTGVATDNASRVWASGLRNPFRFTVRPDTGTPGKLYIGDVGWSTWEELNHGQMLAENFGWPCWEGPKVQPSYDPVDPNGECDDASVFTKPLWYFNHSNPGSAGFTMQCISGMQVYQGANYPSRYTGRLFFCEYSSDFIRTVRFVNGKPTEVELFGDHVGNPVDLIEDPTNGDLIYVAIGANSVRRIRYTKSNHPPIAVAAVSPRFGQKPLTVTLDASGSTDPEGQPLSYFWDLGDGNTDTNPVVTHVYPNGVNYTARLTVTDPGGETGTATSVISVDNTPPQVTGIQSPPAGSFFTDGQLLNFSGTATDAEDGTPPTAEWIIDLIHDHHVHPAWEKLTGYNASWTVHSSGPGTYYHVTFKVTDSRKMSASQGFDLFDAGATPQAHIVAVSDVAPRLGVPFEMRGHLHYAGKGSAELVFDWGDGTTTKFHVSHEQDRHPTHLYSGPGLYTVRLRASDGVAVTEATQEITVRPKLPGVAIYAPITATRWIDSNEQYSIADEVATALRGDGHEAEIFGNTNQAALAKWMNNYMNDGLRDYVVVLDVGATSLYAGEDDGSLAETWMESGNGILWTGFDPFGVYVDSDGNESDVGAGRYALDELLDASVAKLDNGSGSLQLLPPAADLPFLKAYNDSRGILFKRLGADWSEGVTYADEGAGTSRQSDALVLTHVSGGEYAQFQCVNVRSPYPPRTEVIRDFLRTHVLSGLPAGPDRFQLRIPLQKEKDVAPIDTAFEWQPGAGATSWLFELCEDRQFEQPVEIRVVTGTTRITLDRLLKPTTNYFWRVTARNDYGTQMSPPREFRTGRVRKKFKK